MSRSAKVGMVVAGYVAAILAGGLAARLYDARVPYDTSEGMYAAGQAMCSVAAFLVVSLIPTLLALWFLRRHERFWNGVGVLSVGFAAAGLIAALLFRTTTPTGVLALVSVLGLAALLSMPFWAVAFLLFASLAPTRVARRKLMIAVGIELAIGICGLVYWFVSKPPL
jgi:hypothetical protein